MNFCSHESLICPTCMENIHISLIGFFLSGELKYQYLALFLLFPHQIQNKRSSKEMKMAAPAHCAPHETFPLFQISFKGPLFVLYMRNCINMVIEMMDWKSLWIRTNALFSPIEFFHGHIFCDEISLIGETRGGKNQVKLELPPLLPLVRAKGCQSINQWWANFENFW